MNEKPSPPDWGAARGEKWSAHLPGLEAMLRPVDDPLIRALQLEKPSRIAEVGCGGGGTTMEVRRRAPLGSVVHGFDLSPKLIEVAQGRWPSDDRGLVFAVADMATAAPETPYDRLLSRFGVMFFDDAPAAFANLARWLAPGGRFAFAVWGRASDNPWYARVREEVARVVEVPELDPDAPGAFRYAEPDTFLTLLETAGFTTLEVNDWRGALAVGGGRPAAEAARFALSSFSTFAEMLERAGDDARDTAERALTTFFSSREQGGVVHLEACVHIVTGTRS
jgi:trans-aconitate methyltransferase